MKQILQNLSNGETLLVEVPCPKNIKKHILISTNKTVISAGTERMLVDFGRANLLNKALQQPDKVKMVLDKVKTDGFFNTVDSVRSKLDQPLPLGYCNSGIVVDSNVDEFDIGDRVVSNGNHAEVVRVPRNLCAKIPDNVDDESAAFTVIGSIGLQGVRLIKPTIGECIVVTGLGLIGLMCVQMLRANGCRVLGLDYSSKKCEIARNFGAEVVDLSKNKDPINAAKTFSRGRGVDGVLITAASSSDELIHQAAEMCRIRGRIVLVGVVGLNLRRDDFYKKEISFQVSSSYGPGRYDESYEIGGNDYPVGFVRWTEQRNFEAVLDLMSSGALDLKPIITHRYEIDDALKAYELLNDSEALGIVLNYPNSNEEHIISSNVDLNKQSSQKVVPSSKPIVGFIGAGNYASRILLPAFKEAGAILDTIVTRNGISGVHHGKKYGFKSSSTDQNDLWANKDINTVSIVTRHNDHAHQVIDALSFEKNVFVEKPLALNIKELDVIERFYQKANSSNKVRLMVGFNRRFAPHIIKMKDLLLDCTSPKSVIMTINSGEISGKHWVHDHQIGGGRIIGEVCHFIDLMRYLIGFQVKKIDATMIGASPGIEIREDKVSITLLFEDGSIGTIHYFANGGSVFPKERVEVFCENAVLQLDNYRVLRGFGWRGFRRMKLFKQDKGQKACVKAFIDSISNDLEAPIPFNEIIESSKLTIQVANLLRG